MKRELPQAIDVEKAILGSILTEKSAMDKIIDMLKSDMFYLASHKIIYNSAVDLYNQNIPIDLFTIKEHLKDNDIIDAMYLFEITGKTSVNLEEHALIVRQKWIAREIIKISAESQEKAYTEDIADVISGMEKRLTEITENNDEEVDFVEILHSTKRYMVDMQRRREAGEDVALPTPLKQENELLAGGFRAPELIILAGRPAMGKTQIAVEHLESFLKHGSGAFFSLEMSKRQIMLRMIARSGVSLYNIRKGQMSNEEWRVVDERLGELSNYKLSIFDNVRTINGIVSKCRKLKRKKSLDFVIIDYLQLVRTDEKFQTRDLEVGSITNKLKSLAIELDVPIVLLSQLNRETERTRGQRPVLSNLRDSGNIEQDADIVMLIHRPSYYNPEAVDGKGIPWRNRGELIIAKHREGSCGTVIFQHDEQFKRIWDYNEFDYSDTLSDFEKKKIENNKLPF